MIDLGSMKPKKIKISAVIITKNEEKNIRECLESLKDIVDEIIVVDSYSDDNTVEIVRKYTNKIYFKKFQDDFSKQRNFGLQKTMGDWIITLDADERLSRELKKEIPHLVKSKKYRGYFFPRKNYIDSVKYLRYGIFYPDYQLKLFKRGIKYKGMLHAQPKLNEKLTQKVALDIIHNDSHTKYNKFSSVICLKEPVRIQSREILKEERRFLLYPFIGFYKFIKYFIDSFFLGKGFLDGWAGFRAALVFSTLNGVAYSWSLFLKFEKLWRG